MLLNGCRLCEHHRSASRPGSHGGSVSGHGLLMLVDVFGVFWDMAVDTHINSYIYIHIYAFYLDLLGYV